MRIPFTRVYRAFPELDGPGGGEIDTSELDKLLKKNKD